MALYGRELADEIERTKQALADMRMAYDGTGDPAYGVEAEALEEALADLQEQKEADDAWAAQTLAEQHDAFWTWLVEDVMGERATPKRYVVVPATVIAYDGWGVKDTQTGQVGFKSTLRESVEKKCDALNAAEDEEMPWEVEDAD